MKVADRLQSETHEIVIPSGDGDAKKDIRIAVGLACDADGKPVELVLNRIDRARDDLADVILSECAVAASRLLQGRDPTTGEG